ncbi:peptidase inhibitor family I36 protein [Amycolatopsis sp. CA-230715]|uniref:peptidase inhibitor family I36 protein n=1 Tax=Amycolatopsis sp. CA-230715 TaxID=2745196 RepID=UPI0020B1C572|nr:peptidase inhibitor family I36 protein [Amycolatopsis sp. CA-230715]
MTSIAARSAVVLAAATASTLPAVMAHATPARPPLTPVAPGSASAVASQVNKDIIASGQESGVVDARVAGGWDRCPAGFICLFDFCDGQGKMAYFKWRSPDLRAQGMNDMTSAVWNRADADFDLYEGYNYTGLHSRFDRGMRVNLSWWGGDNFDSSLRRR